MNSVRLNLKPGQKGTKRLLEKYGNRLVCVRYRYDETSNRRSTTVELVESEEPWYPGNQLVLIRVTYEETTLRTKIKEAGGIWHKNRRRWELPYRVAVQLGLQGRIEK